jgi:hypothetical protein
MTYTRPEPSGVNSVTERGGTGARGAVLPGPDLREQHVLHKIALFKSDVRPILLDPSDFSSHWYVNYK